MPCLQQVHDCCFFEEIVEVPVNAIAVTILVTALPVHMFCSACSHQGGGAVWKHVKRHR